VKCSALTLTLYTRSGCHLCEEMQQALADLQRRYQFGISLVDVDADNLLELRYGQRVPLLSAGDRELCHYHLNEAAVLSYLRQPA